MAVYANAMNHELTSLAFKDGWMGGWMTSPTGHVQAVAAVAAVAARSSGK